MKTIGQILIIAGLTGVITFGIEAINDSESFNLFGLDIAVSTANWTPLIVSGAVTIIGVLLALAKKTTS